MPRRTLGLSSAVAVVFFLSVAPAQAQDDSTQRTPWGTPDLNGVWDYRTFTPLERPEASTASVPSLLGEVAQDGYTRLRSTDRVGVYNEFWVDLRGEGQSRSFAGHGPSEIGRAFLIVDPPNGRIPPQKQPSREDVVEDSGPEFRCIPTANLGSPMRPGGYNQNVQVFQTRDHVVLLNEMGHSARIIPVDGLPPLREGLRQWAGDSRGHWEGNALIVETTNFRRATGFHGRTTTDDLHLTERFQLVSRGTLLYQVTVDDPNVWERSWTYQLPMVRSDQPIFENACHEGNISFDAILTADGH